MATLEYDVGVDVKAALKGVNKLQGEFKDLRGEMKKTDRTTKSTTDSFGGMKAAAAALALAMTAFKGVQVAAEFETLRATLKSVTGSTEEAAVAFQFVQEIAKGMPFDLQQVTTAYTKMTALGITPTKEALMSFANTASATGKSLDQFVEAVADAVTGEFERLKEFGIKVKSEGDKLKVTFQGMEQTIGKDAASIQGYLQSIGETQFAGAAAEQMNTLTGKWTNFVDQLSTFSDEAANSSGAMDLLKDALDAASEAVEFMRENMGDMADFMTNDVPEAIAFMLDALGPIGDMIRSMVEESSSEINVMSEAFSAMFSDTRQFAISFVDVVVQQLLFLGKQWDILAEGMSFGWDTSINAVRTTFNSFVNDFLSLWNTIADSGFGKLAGLDGLKVELLDVTNNTESWASRMQRVNSEYDKNLTVHKDAIGLWHEEVAVQNELKEVEKQREETAKKLNLELHNKSLKERQKVLVNQVNDQKAAAQTWEAGWGNAFDNYVASAGDAANNAARVFNTSMSSMEDALVEFTKTGKLNFKDMANAIIEDLIRIQIRKAAVGVFGGFSGGGGSQDIFGGFFARGGYLPAGQVGIVGERGPEMINGPATITPIDTNASSGSAGQTVVYNINAVDALSFRQLVARDPEFIYSITQEGRRGLPYT